jgi:hypothetical protein
MNIETFLARLYTDEGLRNAFIAAPLDIAVAHGASPSEAAALAAMDMESLTLAARSFARKRDHHAGVSERQQPERNPQRD